MTNSQLVKQIQSAYIQAERPEIGTGMEVEVHQKIKEGNKERVQKFKGIVIAVAGKTALEKAITVRRKVGPFGVERVFPIHSPTITQIDILRQFKVRRKSIKFIKELTGKASRLKEVRK
jgi:large subunit ribosomal protein L19